MFLSIIYMPYMYWHTTIKYANMLTISKSWRVRKLWIVSSAGVAQSRKVCLHVLQGITCIYTIFILFPWNPSSPCQIRLPEHAWPINALWYCSAAPKGMLFQCLAFDSGIQNENPVLLESISSLLVSVPATLGTHHLCWMESNRCWQSAE